MRKDLTVKNMSRIAILGALAGVLMFLDFPIGIAPDFYKLDLANIPCLISSFAMGPIPGVLTVVLKILIKLILKGSRTVGIGEIADFVISGVFCLSAAIIYQHNKSKHNAIKAMMVSTLLTVIVAVIMNYYVLLPFYSQFLSLEGIIAAGAAIFSSIHTKWDFVLTCVLLFNVIKFIITDFITLIIYKKISPLLK